MIREVIEFLMKSHYDFMEVRRCIHPVSFSPVTIFTVFKRKHPLTKEQLKNMCMNIGDRLEYYDKKEFMIDEHDLKLHFYNDMETVEKLESDLLNLKDTFK